ncbi:MAG: TIGR03084 family metal-binding protein [Hyphomonadaceae bacterium]
MISEADDFLAETEALGALVADLEPARYGEKTQFKDWSVNAVLQHLHTWNYGAHLSLTDEAGVLDFMARTQAAPSLRAFETDWLAGLEGPALRTTWLDFARKTADAFRGADPKLRLKWFGPDMSARSSITARQMETWAHAHEVFDHFGAQRAEADRLRNIAHLGVSTFGWTFANRRRKPPEPAPYVRLTAPSGALWEWNAPSDDHVVAGSALEFCQVVTQTRNVGDTKLIVKGPAAEEWMSLAQCFAGPPNDPPPAGTRFRRAS